MKNYFAKRVCARPLFFLIILLTLVGCASSNRIPMDAKAAKTMSGAPLYIIGPGDSIQLFVWGNPDLSTVVPVRPDGRITTPLIEDIQASGKTPSQLARDMEKELQRFVKNPVVTVIVTGFIGRYSEQIRIVGEAAKPQAIPYTEHMTLLDTMIAVGGLTEFAAGNKASIVRKIQGKQKQFKVRLDDLLKDGDISANMEIKPGDILIIPEAWF